MIIVSAVHLLRVVFTGAYVPPRRFNYLLGLALFVLAILLNFTGYILRWDTGIQWALVVGTNLVKTIPLIGRALYRMLVGGAEPGLATLTRFYAWHIFGLTCLSVHPGWSGTPSASAGMGASPFRHPPCGQNQERITRFELVRREVLAMLLTGSCPDPSFGFLSRTHCRTHHEITTLVGRCTCALVLPLGSANAQMG